MKVYAVFQQGVYRHECCGVFTSHEVAKHVARASSEQDVDGHHYYEVVPFTLDERPIPCESDPVWRVTRKDFRYWGTHEDRRAMGFEIREEAC